MAGTAALGDHLVNNLTRDDLIVGHRSWRKATIYSTGRGKMLLHINTLRPRQNGRNFPDDIFKWIFLNENVWISIDQSHRCGRRQAACREPAVSYDKTTRTAICFEHKMQYLLLRAPYTRIVVFWHISNIPPMISQSQISCITPTFV